jgi:hypothetical protein
MFADDDMVLEVGCHNLSLSAKELASTVQALYHEIHDRLVWAMEEGHWYRQTPLVDAQVVLSAMITSYQKALLLIKEVSVADNIHLDDDFMTTFTFTPEVWTVLDHLTLAETWHEIPTS